MAKKKTTREETKTEKTARHYATAERLLQTRDWFGAEIQKRRQPNFLRQTAQELDATEDSADVRAAVEDAIASISDALAKFEDELAIGGPERAFRWFDAWHVTDEHPFPKEEQIVLAVMTTRWALSWSEFPASAAESSIDRVAKAKSVERGEDIDRSREPKSLAEWRADPDVETMLRIEAAKLDNVEDARERRKHNRVLKGAKNEAIAIVAVACGLSFDRVSKLVKAFG